VERRFEVNALFNMSIDTDAEVRPLPPVAPILVRRSSSR
jgi:hypothetical protein